MCVCVCYVCGHTYALLGARGEFGNRWISPSTVWFLVIKFRFIGLTRRVFTNWYIYWYFLPILNTFNQCKDKERKANIQGYVDKPMLIWSLGDRDEIRWVELNLRNHAPLVTNTSSSPVLLFFSSIGIFYCKLGKNSISQSLLNPYAYESCNYKPVQDNSVDNV